MVFSSIIFLFRFLPVAFLFYYIAPKKMKNFVLLILSLIFYAWGEIKYLPIMFYSIIVDYLCGLGIKKYNDNKALKRTFLLISVLGNLGMLFFFKYTNFFVENINSVLKTTIPMLSLSLPLGISFYTFQTMSYTIDVYRGKVEAEKNIINFGAFVALFPQLIAGPIVKYSDISNELKNHSVSLSGIEKGIRLFIMGLGSKVLIANNIGALWTEVESLDINLISSGLALLGIIAFAFQIYFDFSGYSLMAIGLGHMLGFNFPKNFNYPYISKSITEFWRRWHITLSSWFKEYLYIPLGGNRVGTRRHYFNLFVVWFCTGFWHGANWNFIFWGIFFFVVLMFEKRFLLNFLEKSKVISHIYVIIILILSWTLFAITDLNRLLNYLIKMFNFTGGVDWIYYLRNYGVTLILCIIFSTPLVKNIYDKKIKYHPILKTVLLAVVLIFSVAYLVDASYNPFLYFRF